MSVNALSDDAVKNYHRKARAEDELKKQREIRKEFLRKQIIEHDRIDLLMTEVLGYIVKDFHLLMWVHRKHQHRKIEKQRWHLVLAPRGAGKSTIMTVASAIHSILKNPNVRILIASKKDGNAQAFLSEIKKKLESPKFIEIFGEYKGDLWNDGEINVKPRTSTEKEPTISTIGLGSALASRHFDEIYADDLVDEDNSKTEAQREKIKTWFFKILDPTLLPSGMMTVIGTRYHYADLYGSLIESHFSKKNKKGKVLKEYFIRIPSLLRKKKAPKNAKPTEKYVSFWPEEFTVRFLLHKRKTQGTIIFNSQMQNDVEAMKGKIFQYDWFRWISHEELDMIRDELVVFQGVDLAIKQQEDADKFAHVTIGIHKKTKQIYVLDYYNRVTHYTDQKAVILDKFIHHDPVRVFVEANGYQRALLQDMRSDDNLGKVRAMGVFTDTDKIMRAWKLSAYFERHQVVFLEGMTDLQEHLLKFPDGRYKDLFDALDIAINGALGKQKKVREKEPGLL